MVARLSKALRSKWGMGCTLSLAMVGGLFFLHQGLFAASSAKTLLLHAASYGDLEEPSIWTQLTNRLKLQPFNIVSTLLFLGAIIHTFFTHKITTIAHHLEERHRRRFYGQEGIRFKFDPSLSHDRGFPAEMMHFLGEVEAVFFIWVIPLLISMTYFFSWHEAVEYIQGCDFTEPMFVVVIMTIASSRPIVNFAENSLSLLAKLGGNTPGAWWLTILSVGPLLGSFITEPAAMTLCAMLLIKQFYHYRPPPLLAYATVGLLFVNVSVGGTLTHFAAPPVLMVAKAWHWDTFFMFSNFGWKAATGIVVSNSLYFLIFHRQFKKLGQSRDVTEIEKLKTDDRAPVPLWITLTHLGLLAWIVATGHYPAMFIGAFLLYLAFYQATAPHQNHLFLRAPVLVGCFLAGLVIHGSLQEWWISIVLSRVGEGALMLIGIFLTAFNDNAAITYLSSLVPSFTEGMKLSIVAGAVAGGGLTVIANAPNPAGYSLLQKHFEDGISPLWLFLAAATPTFIVSCCLAFL